MIGPVPPEAVLGGVILALVGLLAYCVRLMVGLVLRGQLVPRSALDDANREKSELRDLLVESLRVNDRLVDHNEVVAKVLDALPHAESKGR